MTLVKSHARIGVHTRFGPNWTGKRCLAKTCRSTACQRVRTSTMGAQLGRSEAPPSEARLDPAEGRIRAKPGIPSLARAANES